MGISQAEERESEVFRGGRGAWKCRQKTGPRALRRRRGWQWLRGWGGTETMGGQEPQIRSIKGPLEEFIQRTEELSWEGGMPRGAVCQAQREGRHSMDLLRKTPVSGLVKGQEKLPPTIKNSGRGGKSRVTV